MDDIRSLTEGEKLKVLLPVLKLAREKITSFSNWTDGPEAVDRFGQGVSATYEKACKWCAVGSVRWASHILGMHYTYLTPFENILDKATKYLHGSDIRYLVGLNERGPQDPNYYYEDPSRILPKETRHHLVLGVMDFVLQNDDSWLYGEEPHLRSKEGEAE